MTIRILPVLMRFLLQLSGSGREVVGGGRGPRGDVEVRAQRVDLGGGVGLRIRTQQEAQRAGSRDDLLDDGRGAVGGVTELAALQASMSRTSRALVSSTAARKP